MERIRALLNAIMNLRVPQTMGNFFSSWKPASFSGTSVLHGIIIIIIIACFLFLRLKLLWQILKDPWTVDRPNARLPSTYYNSTKILKSDIYRREEQVPDEVRTCLWTRGKSESKHTSTCIHIYVYTYIIHTYTHTYIVQNPRLFSL